MVFLANWLGGCSQCVIFISVEMKEETRVQDKKGRRILCLVSGISMGKACGTSQYLVDVNPHK